jgi:hypothetical protein
MWPSFSFKLMFVVVLSFVSSWAVGPFYVLSA